MTAETLSREPEARPAVRLGTAHAATEQTGPHGEQLTSEQLADIRSNKDIAALSYLWILSVVMYYHHRSSPFIHYHSKQGMWLFALSIPIFLVPGIGQYLSFFTLAGMVIGFLNAAHGHYHEIPVIGRLASGTLTIGGIWRKALEHGAKALGAAKRGVLPKKEAPHLALDGALRGKKDSGGSKLSWLPFGRIPFLKRGEVADGRVPGEPPPEVVPTSPSPSSVETGAGLHGTSRGKAMLSLSALPIENMEHAGTEDASPPPKG
jgi:uncharacterized membrane protein